MTLENAPNFNLENRQQELRQRCWEQCKIGSALNELNGTTKKILKPKIRSEHYNELYYIFKS